MKKKKFLKTGNLIINYVWTGVRCRVPKGNNLFNVRNRFFL